MGYYIYAEGQQFRLPAEKKTAALAAVKRIGEGEPNVGNGGGYSWVGDFRSAETLADALGEWRYAAHENEAGDIVELEFTGEKYGDDEIVFDAIAPFVDPGSYLDFRGEEGELWRWWFNGSTCEQAYATITVTYPEWATP